MQTSAASADLDLLRHTYFRAVALLSADVAHGGDLRALCAASIFSQNPDLAKRIPDVSASVHGARPNLAQLVDQLAAGHRVRDAIRAELGRSCMELDVISCVGRYHDRELAGFWLCEVAR